MKTYLITFVIHNSRKSLRMRNLGIQQGEILYLSLEERTLIKQILLSIIQEFTDTVSMATINILDDHVHLIATLLPENLSNFVRKLKGKSTYLYKKHFQIEGEFHLWARKFNRKILDSEESKVRAFKYVENNHLKHKLDKI